MIPQIKRQKEWPKHFWDQKRKNLVSNGGQGIPSTALARRKEPIKAVVSGKFP